MGLKKRKVSVEIYEKDNSGNETTITILEGLSVNFSINKYRGNAFSNGKISIAGLKKEHIELITFFFGAYQAITNNKFIRLKAGYVEEKTYSSGGLVTTSESDYSEVIFDGIIFTAIPSMPPDNWVEMEVMSNVELLAYSNNVNIQTPTSFSDLMQQVFPLFGINNIVNYSTSNNIVNKFVLNGSLSALQDKLYNMYHNDKVFFYESNKVIIDDWNNPKRPSVTYRINSQNGMVFIPKPTTFGCDVTIFLDPTFDMTSFVEISSEVIPSLNDYEYSVYSLTHHGSSRENPFYTTLRCARLPK